MKKIRIVAGLLAAALLMGIPGTLKAAAIETPSVSSSITHAAPQKQNVRVTADQLNIRKAADNKSKITGLLKKGDVCTIVETKKDSRGVTWGKLSNGKGWINLSFTEAVFKNYRVQVTASTLNARKDANAKSDVLSVLKKGDIVTITAEKKDSKGAVWGKLDDGKSWIHLGYTKKTNDAVNVKGGAVTVKYKAKVTSTTLNIRQSTSDKSAIKGTLKKGAEVSIVAEQTDSKGTVWGKLSDGKGWVCLKYVKKVEAFSKYDVKVTAYSLNIRKSASNTSAVQGVLKKDAVVTIVEEKKDNRGVTWGKLSNGKGWINLDYTKKTSGSTFKSYSVKVTADSLNIRKSPNNTSAVVGYLKKGNVFTIVEEKKDSRGVTWGKLSNGDGWINLDYTKKV